MLDGELSLPPPSHRRSVPPAAHGQNPGEGGVGKTRLALQVATVLGPEFPVGVWLVELAPLGDPSAVPDAIAADLGSMPQDRMSVADTIAQS